MGIGGEVKWVGRRKEGKRKEGGKILGWRRRKDLEFRRRNEGLKGGFLGVLEF